MKKSLVGLGLLCAMPLGAMEVEENKLVLTAEEQAACMMGGGCVLVPRAVLIEKMNEMAQAAYAAGKRECPSRL